MDRVELAAVLLEERQRVALVEPAAGISRLWLYIDTQDAEAGSLIPASRSTSTRKQVKKSGLAATLLASE